MNIDKLLFFDIECATSTDNYQKDIPEQLKKKWKLIANNFRKRYPEELTDKTDEEIFYLKGMLYPEFGRVVCVSFGYEDSNGQFKKLSFYGDNEKEILESVNRTIIKSKNFVLAGFNIKKFDIPYLFKRMLICGIKPAQDLICFDKKPWELQYLDIVDIYNNGQSVDSVGNMGLEAILGCFGFSSSKEQTSGDQVSDIFWKDKDYKRIVDYCEQDIEKTYLLTKKIYGILN